MSEELRRDEVWESLSAEDRAAIERGTRAYYEKWSNGRFPTYDESTQDVEGNEILIEFYRDLIGRPIALRREREQAAALTAAQAEAERQRRLHDMFVSESARLANDLKAINDGLRAQLDAERGKGQREALEWACEHRPNKHDYQVLREDWIASYSARGRAALTAAQAEAERVKEKVGILAKALTEANAVIRALARQDDDADVEDCVGGTPGAQIAALRQQLQAADEAYPMQPVVLAADGLIRFRENRLVRWMLDTGSIDMNAISVFAQEAEVPQEEREQFAQLIGYSLRGYAELSYASDASYNRAQARSEALRRSMRETTTDRRQTKHEAEQNANPGSVG